VDACIYCGATVDLQRGQGDHVVPAALGRFEGEFVFRRICPACNSRIGKCEEQILRCAPEAYVRRMIQPSVKRNSRGTSWVGANGMPPPKFLIDHGDHHELVDGSTDDPRNVFPIDQLVIVDQAKGERHVRLFPEMTGQQLLAKINSLGLTPSNRSYLYADDAACPKYVGLLNEIWPDSPVVQSETREAGMRRIQGTTKFTFHADYWRALAKIGFHYCLLNTRRGVRGNEPEFADIRRFILEGGDRDPFFTRPAVQFVMPFRELPDGSALLPGVWTHVLGADESYNAAVAMVSLFMGPERLAPIYHVNLCRFRSPLVVPGARSTHLYIYADDPGASTYAGKVEAVTTTQLR
jgi:hypothetical protein